MNLVCSKSPRLERGGGSKQTVCFVRSAHMQIRELASQRHHIQQSSRTCIALCGIGISSWFISSHLISFLPASTYQFQSLFLLLISRDKRQIWWRTNQSDELLVPKLNGQDSILLFSSLRAASAQHDPLKSHILKGRFAPSERNIRWVPRWNGSDTFRLLVCILQFHQEGKFNLF